jgi:hypothetical protein
MSFGEVFSRAWQIIWKHKVLWLFGILSGCSGASWSAGSNSGYRFSGGEAGFYALDVSRFFNQFSDGLILLLACILLFIALAVVFFFIILSTLGRIGLIRGTLLADQGQKTISFGELFSSSAPYFWRVFGLYLLLLAALLILAPIVALPLTILTCGLGLIALVVALLLLPIVVEQAIIAIVIEDLGILDGLRRGWIVFSKNLGAMILMALILFVGIGLFVGFLVGLPMALLLTPLLAGYGLGSPGATGAGVVIAATCFVCLLPLWLLLTGVLRAYITSAWTLAFLRLTGKSRPTPTSLVEALPDPLTGEFP